MIDIDKYFPKCHGCGDRIWLVFNAVNPPYDRRRAPGCWNHYNKDAEKWFHLRCSEAVSAGWGDHIDKRGADDKAQRTFDVISRSFGKYAYGRI